MSTSEPHLVPAKTLLDDAPKVSCCKAFADDASVSTAAPSTGDNVEAGIEKVSCCKSCSGFVDYGNGGSTEIDNDGAPAVSCCKALYDGECPLLKETEKAAAARAYALKLEE